MSTPQLTLHIAAFGFTLWLGFYLIARDVKNLRLWLAGLVLISYATGVALNIIGHYAPSINLALEMGSWYRAFLLAPAAVWLGLLIHLLRGDGLSYMLTRHARPMGFLLATTLLYAMGIGAIIFPAGETIRTTIVLSLSLNLFVMGVAVAVIDVTEQGEVFWPHFLRALDYSFFTAVLFGGQVVLVMTLATGVTFSMLILLLSTIATSLLVQNFADPVQTLLDGIAFFNLPQLRQTRAEFREASNTAPRFNDSLHLDELGQTEFSRLTRRALSHKGKMPKLASSPLIRLPLVEARLVERGTSASTLVRASELKVVLSESIERLKPPDANGDYGSTVVWRLFYALYFPYVLGLMPYRRQWHVAEVDTAVLPIIEWFRSQVPERTLYNWQTKAAQLVAQDLRERSRQLLVD
jgi:hypothetical protein